MNHLAEPMLASMDWEKLLPVAFFVLYGIAQLIGSLKKGKQKPDEEPEVDVAERARQVREEIRRKIAERRQALEGQGGDQPRPRQYDPTRPDGQPQVFRAPEPPRPPVQSQPQPERRMATRREPEVRPVKRAASHMASLEKRLAEQRSALEKARRIQHEAREQALRIKRKAGVKEYRELSSVGTLDGIPEGNLRLRQEVLTSLRHKEGLKRAILLKEILGSPLGLR